MIRKDFHILEKSQHQKFRVITTLRIAYVGMKKVVDSWNNHSIPGWFRD